jgi:poly [ADP-ribose] polymerase
MEPAGEEEEPPVGKELYGMVIGFAGSAKEMGMTRAQLEKIVFDHEGEPDDDNATFFIAAPSELSKAKKTKKVTQALEAKIPFFSVDYLLNLTGRKEEGISLRKKEVAKKYLLEGSELGDEPLGRKYFKERAEREERGEGAAPAASSSSAVAKRPHVAEMRPAPRPGSDILKVDPEYKRGGEILVTHDNQYGYTPYHVMLNVTDLSTGVNKFYRMQIIKQSSRCTFFIHWGRTGTDIGDRKEYPGLSEDTAITRFEEKFKDCTGVDWSERQWFDKRPGKYNLTELDDGNEVADTAEVEKRRATKKQKLEDAAAAAGGGPVAAPGAVVLDPRVRSFVASIFDKDMMKKQLKAMDIDVKKMPLGKISKKQIQSAYAVLNAASEALQQKEVSVARIRDCSNRFYTLVPHDFGEKDPPLIQDDETIRQKLQLLDTLCEIEVANALMQEAGEEGDRVLKNYQSLKTRITPLDKEGERYKMLEQYAYDSHDTGYFRGWTFKVDDILELEREGETPRFQPWSANDNRQLLWHGSRLTNYVGILSNGLRIAPPEAPKTGYRFGKGIYFANCSSKSASYCFTTRESPHGVMILNEVAVGRPWETPKDTYMEKAVDGFDCTWAQGMCVPDPAGTVTIEDGIKVPKGKPIQAGRKTMCTHDEIIVYTIEQIRIRYLLRVTFTHK